MKRMRASCGLYPALGRFFGSLEELARAGCMSRERMRLCLKGEATFTDAEKEAIANAIIVRIYTNELRDENILRALEARKDFDRIYRTSEAA